MDKLKVVPVNYYELAKRVAEILQVELIEPEIKRYPNGCIEVILPKEVRNYNVFVFFTSIPSNELPFYLLATQLTLNAVYECAASKVHLVMPYFSYARSDKKEGRMGIAAKIIARNFLSATDGHTPIITFDLHAPQVEGFFERIDNFSTFKIIIPYLRSKNLDPEKTIVLPDDVHSLKKAKLISEHFGFELGYVVKTRLSEYKVIINSVQGNYKNKTVIIAADEICTGGTIISLIKKIEKEVKEVILVAAHGVFAEKAKENLSHPLIKEIIVSNTLPISDQIKETLKVTVIDIAPFLAKVLQSIHLGMPLSEFFKIS